VVDDMANRNILETQWQGRLAREWDPDGLQASVWCMDGRQYTNNLLEYTNRRESAENTSGMLADAVDMAPDGTWIRGGEEKVRDLFSERVLA
jgi:hypothetical protein